MVRPRHQSRACGTSGSKPGINQQETVQRGQYSFSSNAVLTVLADGDGASNRQEYLAGTDPRDGQGVLRIGDIQSTFASEGRVRCVAVSNRTYSLQKRNHLNAGAIGATSLTSSPLRPIASSNCAALQAMTWISATSASSPRHSH